MKLWEITEHMEAGAHSVLSFVGAGGKTSCILELAGYFAAQGQKVLVTTSTHMEHPDFLGRPGMVDRTPQEILEEIEAKGWTIAGTKAEHPEKIQGLSHDTLRFLKGKVDKILIEADGSKRYPVKVPGDREPVIWEETTHIFILAGAGALGRALSKVCFRLEQAEEILGNSQKELSVEMLGHLLEEGYVKKLKQEHCKKKLAVILNQTDLLKEPYRVTEELQSFISVPVFSHPWEKAVHLILLAAGFSRRFGENKLLYEMDHVPMYQHLFGRLREIKLEGKADSLVVVSQYEEIIEAVNAQGICAVKNENSARGISSSLQLGLEKSIERRQEGKKTYYMFFVADQPYLQKETIGEFLSAFLKSGQKIGCVSKEKEPKNPVIFHERYIPELMELRGDTGGKKVLRRHMEDVFFFDVPEEKELMDCDCKTDVTE